jgi:hypothetical protein
MTSLRTDFEMHAIWQGYTEDPAAKDFVARKACSAGLAGKLKIRKLRKRGKIDGPRN